MAANGFEGGHELTRGNRSVLRRRQLQALAIGSYSCKYCAKHVEAYSILGRSGCGEHDLSRVVLQDTLTCQLCCA